MEMLNDLNAAAAGSLVLLLRRHVTQSVGLHSIRKLGLYKLLRWLFAKLPVGI